MRTQSSVAVEEVHSLRPVGAVDSHGGTRLPALPQAPVASSKPLSAPYRTRADQTIPRLTDRVRGAKVAARNGDLSRGFLSVGAVGPWGPAASLHFTDRRNSEYTDRKEIHEKWSSSYVFYAPIDKRHHAQARGLVYMYIFSFCISSITNKTVITINTIN